MPLELFQRGSTWWVRGRVEYNGRRVGAYVRESARTSDATDARRYADAIEAAIIRTHLVGPEGENRPLTFAEAVAAYPAKPKEAAFLLPIIDRIGIQPVRTITPAAIRALAREIYPDAATDTWTRQVVTPIRAVINHAHDLWGGDVVPPIRVRGFTEAQRLEQDAARGKPSRPEVTPGDWQWHLRFYRAAIAAEDPFTGALALFMFTTGARLGQATAIHPRALDAKARTIIVPGAKGHADRTLELPKELAAILSALPPKWPRTWERTPENQRLFGFAGRHSVYKPWAAIIAAADLPDLKPHAAGRHGFGQEHRVRRKVDDKAVEQFGGWSDTGILQRTYSHAENSSNKILRSWRTGLVQAEKKTGIKLLNNSH